MNELFSIKELGTLKEVMSRTWQEIGADLVQIVGSPASRDLVFEAVTDRMNGFGCDPEEERLIAKFISLPYKRMQGMKEILLPMEFYE